MDWPDIPEETLCLWSLFPPTLCCFWGSGCSVIKWWCFLLLRRQSGRQYDSRKPSFNMQMYLNPTSIKVKTCYIYEGTWNTQILYLSNTTVLWLNSYFISTCLNTYLFQSMFPTLINFVFLVENLGHVTNFLHIFFIFILFIDRMVAFCQQIIWKE